MKFLHGIIIVCKILVPRESTFRLQITPISRELPQPWLQWTQSQPGLKLSILFTFLVIILAIYFNNAGF